MYFEKICQRSMKQVHQIESSLLRSNWCADQWNVRFFFMHVNFKDCTNQRWRCGKCSWLHILLIYEDSLEPDFEPDKKMKIQVTSTRDRYDSDTVLVHIVIVSINKFSIFLHSFVGHHKTWLTWKCCFHRQWNTSCKCFKLKVSRRNYAL